MPWQVRYLESCEVVEVRYEGMVPMEELVAVAEAGLEKARDRGTHLVLADCTALLGGHSVTDLYFLARQLDQDHEFARMKEAVLMPAHGAPIADAEFWEAASQNRGFNVRVFTDREEALGWLAGGPARS